MLQAEYFWPPVAFHRADEVCINPVTFQALLNSLPSVLDRKVGYGLLQSSDRVFVAVEFLDILLVIGFIEEWQPRKLLKGLKLPSLACGFESQLHNAFYSSKGDS